MDNLFIKGTLNEVLKKLERKKGVSQRIMEIWNELGPEYRRDANPSFLSRKVLYVDVEDPNWLYFFSLKKEELKERFKDLFEEGLLKDIKFRVGRR
jgi:DNA-binding Lrp family transcriptional regulator